jgi:rubrerythrin
MVNAKHIATFLLGAAAGAALMKYNSMTPEEQEELMKKLKDQAAGLKDEAEKATDTVKNYMEELREKGMDSLKEYMGYTEKYMADLFQTNKTEPKV